MATLRRSPLLPQVSRVLCIWLPKESHRYSRRFPAFYVFGYLKRVIDTPAGYLRFMCCQLSDIGQRGHLPRVYLPNGSNVSPRTDSDLGHCITRRFTDLRISRHHRVSPVYFELTILDSFPDLSISASLPCISNATSWSSWELCISRSPALSLGLLISRYLDLQGTSSVFVSAPLLAN